MPLLADGHRLIAPDLRGFGWSDCPAGGYDPPTFAADAVALLDALGVDQTDVIGHDWGGAAAFVMALNAPGRVRRMVILNTVAPWVEPSPQLLAGAWRSWYAVVMAVAGDRVVRTRPEALADGIRSDAVHPEGMTEQDALAYALRLGEPARARATKLLYRTYLKAAAGRGPFSQMAERRLTQPTRFLFGANDGAISPHVLRGVESHGDDLTVELVPDSGHFICEEKPALVAERARELFAG
jgi:pimeloyl-ACP methyl ester carboxylesterase